MRTPKQIAEAWIDCTCDEAYTSRGLVAPDCPLHSFAAEEAIADAQKEAWNKALDAAIEYSAWDITDIIKKQILKLKK